jgi:hypothetical protein
MSIKLEELSMDAWYSPKRVVTAHLANQFASLEWKRLMTSLPPSSGPSAFDKKALFSTTAATDSLNHYDFDIDTDLTTGATSFSMSRREYRRVMAEADKVGLSAAKYLRQVWQPSVERLPKEPLPMIPMTTGTPTSLTYTPTVRPLPLKLRGKEPLSISMSSF